MLILEYIKEDYGSYALCIKKEAKHECLVVDALFLSPEKAEASRFIGRARLYVLDSNQGTYVYECARAYGGTVLEVARTGMGYCKDNMRFFLILESLHIDAVYDHPARRVNFILSLGQALQKLGFPYLYTFDVEHICGPMVWQQQSGMLQQLEDCGYEFFCWDDSENIYARTVI